MKHIGLIGLGTMGLPMGKNILKGGYLLHVCPHQNTAPADELAAMGAIREPSLNALAGACDCILSILPSDREIAAVLLDPAFLAALRPGTIVVEMSSSSAEIMQQLAAACEPRQVAVLDAPVSGGPAGAAAGTLTLFCGGTEQVLEEVRPLLNCLAKTMVLLGGVGTGSAAKSVNQLIAAMNVLIIGEALQVAKQQNIDLEKLQQVISCSSGGSKMFDAKMPLLREDRMLPAAFKLKLMRKDLRLAVQGAGELPLGLTRAGLILFEQAEQAGLDEQDFCAVTKLL